MSTYKMKMIGEIGWNILPEMIEEDLKLAAGTDLEVDLSSIGGSIAKGLIISSLFKDYKKNFPLTQMILNIKGEASSMASHIAALPVWDLITVEETSLHMRHNPKGFASGDYRDMEAAADFLKRYAEVMAIEYSRKSKMSMTQTKKDMDKTTYLFGKEIVDAGFADEVLSPDKSMVNNSMTKDSAILMMESKYRMLMEKIKKEEISHDELEKISEMISMSEIFDIEMPYPNEHAARIIEPSKFQQNTFRRKNIATGIDIIIGKLKNETSMTTQAYRFSVDNFTAAEAKKWLKDNDIKYISFEAASEKKSAIEEQKPAMSGKNKGDKIVKNIAELKTEFPDVHAEAEKTFMQAGINQEKERVKSLLEMKKRKDFEGIVEIADRIDEGIEKGESMQTVELGIMALLKKSGILATMDSNAIGNLSASGNVQTISGEKEKEALAAKMKMNEEN